MKSIIANSSIDDDTSKIHLNSLVVEPSTIQLKDTRTIHMDINFLIWLNLHYDESSDDYQNSIVSLRHANKTVKIFKNADQCIDFLTDMKTEKVFLIVPNSINEILVPLIHEVSQLNSIYILCTNPQYTQSIKSWSKVRGIFTKIDTICQLVKQDVNRIDHDSISFSFISSNDVANQNLNELDVSFMYTQILKEILLEIEYNDQSFRELIDYLRELFDENDPEMQLIAKFEKDYYSQTPIWWYTYPCFIYSILNQALRTHETHTIIKMGIFIRDLHRQIEQLHLDQSADEQMQSFIVYRSQGLSKSDFDKMMKTKGGLMSFNSFLSTSKERDVALVMADSNGLNEHSIGILFEITVHRSISSSPFASLDNISYFNQLEQEILFSMHTVFRIVEIEQMDDTNHIWQVKLTLTDDTDQLLTCLTEYMRYETRGSTGRDRLGHLLLKLDEYDAAEAVYRVLLDQPLDDGERAHFYFMLGHIKNDQKNPKEALSLCEKSLEIYEQIRSPNHLDIASCYHLIGRCYKLMHDYKNAILFLEKAHEIAKIKFPPYDHGLLNSFISMGSLYESMNNETKALWFYEEALKIGKNNFPPNHPSIAVIYNNIAHVYSKLHENSKAILFTQKAFEIKQKSLLSNDSSFSKLYGRLGTIYQETGHYSKALYFYDQERQQEQKTPRVNHYHLYAINFCIGTVYYQMCEYSKAISTYEIAIEHYKKLNQSDDEDLANIFMAIGTTYNDMGEHASAIIFYEKVLKIQQQYLPPNHSKLGNMYNKIGLIYCHKEKYTTALSYLEKFLDIQQQTYPLNHSELSAAYNNISGIYCKMGDFSKALFFIEKALETSEYYSSSNDENFPILYNTLGSIYSNMYDYPKALSYYELALDIAKNILPLDHHHVQLLQKNIKLLKKKMLL
ncbi:unnamed protein product [Adineta ricciae]|uniref:Uncharacterized protein n=1 Tax=Adineta ricciae TaxID=249248 RepID=A0A814VWU1_ADIRI|nr:unnamed protein product [Adineta ricciae]CAF1390574.1 unnamed protein product [Adineta ricciae]